MEVDETPEMLVDHGSGHPEIRALIECPECGIYGEIDHEQFRGEVSIECPKDGCSFHQTVDFRG